MNQSRAAIPAPTKPQMDRTITSRYTQQEHDRLRVAAKTHGITLPKLVRHLTLHAIDLMEDGQ